MREFIEDPLMGLAEFRKLFRLSPSGERRMRNEQQEDWPPHITIGRKIFYFREGVRDFLARQQAARAGVDPELVVPAGSRAGEPALRAPAFSAEQIDWLQGVLGRLFRQES